MLKDVFGHDNIKKDLLSRINKLPKILLFIGPDNVGKEYTALNLIDEIHNGYLNKGSREHPDVLILKPETKVFKLSLIKEVQDFITESSFELNSRYVILNDIHLMNKESANSCLKIFEDTPKNVNFILLAENTSGVMDTILSRSIIFNFYPLNNLSEYYPNLTVIQNAVMNGCIGEYENIKDIDLDKLYNNIFNFISKIKDISYSNIIDFCIENKEVNINLTNNLFIIASKELILKKDDIALTFLNSCKEFKSKTALNINLFNHFKFMLINNKFILENKRLEK